MVEGDSIWLESAVAPEVSEEASSGDVGVKGCFEARYAL